MYILLADLEGLNGPPAPRPGQKQETDGVCAESHGEGTQKPARPARAQRHRDSLPGNSHYQAHAEHLHPCQQNRKHTSRQKDAILRTRRLHLLNWLGEQRRREARFAGVANGRRSQRTHQIRSLLLLPPSPRRNCRLYLMRSRLDSSTHYLTFVHLRQDFASNRTRRPGSFPPSIQTAAHEAFR